MVQDRAIFTMADRSIDHMRLSIESRIWSIERPIFNDLERPLSWFSRSRHFLTLNISQTATDTAKLL